MSKKELNIDPSINRRLRTIKPNFKYIIGTFLGVFGFVWLILEPLSAFGEDKSLKTLGIIGYLFLLLGSICISLIAEILRLHIRNSKNKELLVKALNAFIETNKSIELITGAKAIIKSNIKIIDDAQKIIAVTGSRSRDRNYLKTLEQKLINSPQLIHYRVLWGHPHHALFRNHLLELLKIRDPQNRDYGEQLIYIGLFDNFLMESEKFVCANENEAIVILPSIKGISNYDSALIVRDKTLVSSMLQYCKELYSAGEPIETVSKIRNLKILRTKSSPARGA